MRTLVVTVLGLSVAAAVLAPAAAQAGYCWTPGDFQVCTWLPIDPTEIVKSR